MPQFDFSTYSSQIFWFGLCFAVLYWFLAVKILPRIADIIASRKSVIDKDVADFDKLEAEIAEIEKKSSELLSESELDYRQKLERATKKASANRDEFLQKFKRDSDDILAKSKDSLGALIKDSEEKTPKLIEELSILVKKKIL